MMLPGIRALAFIFPVLSLVGFAPSVYAGAASSGGGKAVVCRDAGKKITSVELLDLFEGRVTYGLSIFAPGPTVEKSLQVVQNKLQLTFENFISFDSGRNLISKAVRDFRLLPPGVGLKPVNDADEVVLPNSKDCTLEQLAFYQDNQILLVDQEIWSAMDVVNQAALFVHEAVYRLERSMAGATNSRHARKIVAHLFSDFAFMPVMQGVPRNAKECYTTIDGQTDKERAFRFYVYPHSDGGRAKIAQFTMLGNKIVYNKVADQFGQWPEAVGTVYPLNLRSPLEPDFTINLHRMNRTQDKAAMFYLQEVDGADRHLITCRARLTGASPKKLSVTPGNPIVITADSKRPTDKGPVRMPAPWFTARYSLSTDQLVTIVGFKTSVLAADGKRATYNTKLPATEIKALSTFTTATQFFDDLPYSKGQSLGYLVEVTALGWVGAKTRPGKPLELRAIFQTQ
jgi:hypothetical protein